VGGRGGGEFRVEGRRQSRRTPNSRCRFYRSSANDLGAPTRKEASRLEEESIKRKVAEKERTANHGVAYRSGERGTSAPSSTLSDDENISCRKKGPETGLRGKRVQRKGHDGRNVLSEMPPCPCQIRPQAVAAHTARAKLSLRGGFGGGGVGGGGGGGGGVHRLPSETRNTSVVKEEIR